MATPRTTGITSVALPDECGETLASMPGPGVGREVAWGILLHVFHHKRLLAAHVPRQFHGNCTAAAVVACKLTLVSQSTSAEQAPTRTPQAF